MIDPTEIALSDAITWGGTNGPKITYSDWERRRGEMVRQYMEQIELAKPQYHGLVQAAWAVIFWNGTSVGADARGTTAFKVLEEFVIQNSHIPEIRVLRKESA